MPGGVSWHLESEAARLSDRLERGDPYWPAQLTVATAIALNLLLTERVTVGPTWLMPSVEGVLLVALIAIVPARATSRSRGRRRFALAVIGLVSATNVASLGLLVHFLINGGKAGGHPLITSGVVLWATNVLLFAVWYWELDGGGPVARHLNPESLRDFQFPQMDNPKFAPPGWRPGYRRLPLCVRHERQRVQPDRHDAAHPHCEGRDDHPVDRRARHNRTGGCASCQRSRLNRTTTAFLARSFTGPRTSRLLWPIRPCSPRRTLAAQ